MKTRTRKTRKSFMSARTIEQTRDVVKAIVTAFHRYDAASSDGDVSWLEWAGFIQLTPDIWKAIKNASEIPAELADLDEAEADELIEEIAVELNLHISNNEMRRKIDKILILFHAAVDALAEWRGVNPPRAVPV